VIIALGLEVMPTIEEIPLGELPETVKEAAARDIAEYVNENETLTSIN